MKFSLHIFLLFLLINQLAFPQWTNQNPVPDGNDLWSTFFVDDSTGWIVGSGGFIKKTTNAGNEWIAQNSGATLILKSVQFADQNTGWICGESGLILQTTNGGSSWFSLTSGTTQHLTDIHFCDLDTGYAVGYGGTILNTTDGGSSWTSQSSGTSYNLNSVDFVNTLLGYTGYKVAGSIHILKTIDGGINWIDKVFDSQSYGEVHTVEFIDADTGFVGGGSSISSFFAYKTTDGGDTWVQLNISQFTPPMINQREELSIYSAGGVNSIYCKDSNLGYAVSGWGGWDRGIWTSTDWGSNWHKKYYGSEETGLFSVYGNNRGQAWAVGRAGVIFMTEDDGNSWAQILSGNNSVHLYSGDFIYSVFMINENLGWAGGIRNKVSQSLKSLILKTTNGGKIWKSQIPRGASMVGGERIGDIQVRCIYFINQDSGWAVSHDYFFRTTDGGENWISMSNIHGSSVFFIDPNIGWVASDYSSYSGIYKSIDGGITWVQKSSISSSSVYFLNNNIGWATSVNGLLKSTDGGETWNTKSSSPGSYIRFYDSNVGMCVGGGILVSTNGGETWNTKSGPSLQSINFINSTTVWGYTSEGTIYKTFDFGDTWNAINVGLGSGSNSFFITEYTGWVGEGNNIWKYSVEPPPPPVPPIWSNQITVKDAGGTESSQALTFGQHIDATDSIDASLGEYEIPPIPPAGIFDARFNLPTAPLVSSLSDYRDSAKTNIIWNMSFQPGSSGYPITFTWDSTAFPEGTFYLKDRINGSFVSVNMKNQSSFVLTSPVIASLSINYKGVSSIVNVNNGWNIISVPLLAEDMSLSNLYPTATSLAYRYDGGYFSEDTLVGGVGYWLKFDANEEILIYGLTQGDTVPVQEGWNMFGVYENDIPVTQLTTTPPGIIATYFFEYNDGYYIADTLKSGQGFWVRVTDDGVINLNGGSLRKDGEMEQFIAKVDQNWGKIIITDNSGKSISLFAAEDKIESNLYELPPMPPTGIFDARYSSGRLVENLSSEKIIQISSDNYPVTMRAEGINLSVRDLINGAMLNEELTDGEEIMITNNKITSIEITGKITGGLPASYELYQNYPNPFNPMTKIKFAIPKESVVNLSIYNALGELVTTLVNSQMQAGYYEYEFNASRLSSGVYLYRIKANSFVETKKMIVIK